MRAPPHLSMVILPCEGEPMSPRVRCLVAIISLGFALQPSVSSAISSRTLLTPTGAVADQLGTSVASAGDVNGDGYADVIVGAPTNDAGGGNAGRAYVYFGGSSVDTSPHLTFTGAAAGDQLGISVASAGAVNRRR